MTQCCVQVGSQIEDWTHVPQDWDAGGRCTEEPSWEVKEGAWDWKPICDKHQVAFALHQDECPEVEFRPVFYVINEDAL